MDTNELDVKIAEQVMGWAWDEESQRWLAESAEGVVYYALDGAEFSPSKRWSDFGLVLERAYELFQRDAVGPNDTLELTWWQHGDCFFRMDECFQAGPPTLGNMGHPLQAMCSAILAALSNGN